MNWPLQGSRRTNNHSVYLFFSMAFSFLKRLFDKQPDRASSPSDDTDDSGMELLDDDTADDYIKGGTGELPKLWNGVPSRDWTIN